MSKQYCSKNTVQSFEEFVAAEQPWDLLAELSAQRALVVEFRQSIEANSEAKTAEFFETAEADIATIASLVKMRGLTDVDEAIDVMQENFIKILKQSYTTTFPLNTRMSAMDALAMSKLLKTIADCAEKYKKIYDGVTIGLSVDQELENALITFVTQYILPNISIQDRLAVSAAVVKYLPGLPTPRTPKAEVIDV